MSCSRTAFTPTRTPSGAIPPAMPGLDQRDDERLLAFRTGLRRFLAWSGQQAEAAGITPAQHQLLLAVRGHPDPAVRPWGRSPGTCWCATTAPSS